MWYKQPHYMHISVQEIHSGHVDNSVHLHFRPYSFSLVSIRLHMCLGSVCMTFTTLLLSSSFLESTMANTGCNERVYKYSSVHMGEKINSVLHLNFYCILARLSKTF